MQSEQPTMWVQLQKLPWPSPTIPQPAAAVGPCSKSRAYATFMRHVGYRHATSMAAAAENQQARRPRFKALRAPAARDMTCSLFQEGGPQNHVSGSQCRIVLPVASKDAGQ